MYDTCYNIYSDLTGIEELITVCTDSTVVNQNAGIWYVDRSVTRNTNLLCVIEFWRTMNMSETAICAAIKLLQ